MKGKVFIDTNILIYAVADNDERCSIAKKLLVENVENITISTQVINEFIEETLNVSKEFMEIFKVKPVDIETVNLAIDIFKKHKFSYWDSLIVSSAILSDCEILYSEDLQDKQKINGLQIKNPFKEVRN